jgi:hypothetical protein
MFAQNERDVAFAINRVGGYLVILCAMSEVRRSAACNQDLYAAGHAHLMLAM